MTLDDQQLRARRAGCLLGQCLGDALGHSVEGWPADECKDYLQATMLGMWHGSAKPTMHAFGQYTDDSQLARELLLSLVARKGFDPEDYAKRIKDLFVSNRVVGRGRACSEAALRLGVGIPWDKAGCPPPMAGNGTAMRAAPIGMVYFNQPEKLIEVARTQGWITHRDPRCDAGSIAIAGAVALAIADRVEPEEFCNQLSEWMAVADFDFAGLVRELPSRLIEPPDQAIHSIALAGLPQGQVPDWPGISPFVVPSVLWSLYCFLRMPDDFFQSIWHSIACGGDVDTTAAMTGAISGAYLGLEALPEHMLLQLHDRGEWRADDLLRLVDRIEDGPNQ